MAIYPSSLPAPIRRAFWKVSYQAISSAWQRADWRTMNYGFDLDDGDEHVPPLPELSAEDAPDRYCFGMYHRVAAQRDLKGLDVLEVGSGRGGGASYVHRYLGPASTIGLDRAASAVELSNRREGCEGLRYVVGDAEDLPFPNEQFDVVINVESCHCYGSIPTFLSEVHRVLRPGGALLLSDLRNAQVQAKFDRELEESPFEVRSRVEVTPGVIRSLQKDTPRRQKMLDESTNFGLRGVMKWFSGVQGSTLYRDLDTRKFVYHCYELAKAE